MDEVNTVVHFGAARARESLTHTKEFLVLPWCLTDAQKLGKSHVLPPVHLSIAAFSQICRETTYIENISRMSLNKKSIEISEHGLSAKPYNLEMYWWSAKRGKTEYVILANSVPNLANQAARLEVGTSYCHL